MWSLNSNVVVVVYAFCLKWCTQRWVWNSRELCKCVGVRVKRGCCLWWRSEVLFELRDQFVLLWHVNLASLHFTSTPLLFAHLLYGLGSPDCVSCCCRCCCCWWCWCALFWFGHVRFGERVLVGGAGRRSLRRKLRVRVHVGDGVVGDGLLDWQWWYWVVAQAGWWWLVFVQMRCGSRKREDGIRGLFPMRKNYKGCIHI